MLLTVLAWGAGLTLVTGAVLVAISPLLRKDAK